MGYEFATVLVFLAIASVFTFFLGLIVVIPLMSLTLAVAYRWLRVGSAAASDVP